MENKKRFKNNFERMQYLDDKQDEIAKRQENELILDYTEALKEENAKALKVNINGTLYDIPSKMPFSFSTYFIKNCYKKVNGKQVFAFEDQSTMFDIVEKIFGKKFMFDLNKQINKNVSLTFLFEKVIPDIMRHWGLDINTKDSNIQKKMMTQG